MNAYKNASFVGIILFLFGLVITFYGFSFLAENNDLEANGVRVKGTVVEIRENAIYRSPFVKFKTLEGQEVIFLSKLEVNKDFFKYAVGMEVNVIYHKDNPNNAEIDDFWERNTAQMYLGFLGIFLMLFGLFFRRRMKKKAKKWAEQYQR